MVKFQGFYTILLLTVLITMVTSDGSSPAGVCDLDPGTDLFVPSAACYRYCENEGTRALCEKDKCVCAYWMS